MIDETAKPIAPPIHPVASVAIDRRTALSFRSLGLAAVALAALFPLSVAGFWIAADPIALTPWLRLPDGAIGDLALTTRLAAMALCIPAVAPLSWALLRLRVCLSEFGAGRPFSAPGISGLRDFAIGTALVALGKPISTALLSPLLSWNAPPGKRQIVVTLDSDVLMLALFAAIIAALTWAMRRAAVVAEENSLFV